ncbi:Peritrophin-1 [Eumeta japonica]|uniref:Peritrophin-1 n=1 Tax=Eumeta variegata TaxID=151549 RepID=A0A4C1Y2M2_EUMVA|nr:Peritrophin-1 [Eumeta japonica]
MDSTPDDSPMRFPDIRLLGKRSDDVEGNSLDNSERNMRKKRLLFYDEDGNLVKTFANPFFKDFFPNIENYPFFGNFYRQFQGFLHPSTYGRPMVYMIPVSDEVVQQIIRDPIYQNKFLLPVNEGAFLPTPLCEGKRTQIPSPNSCSSFLNCWDGWGVEQTCPVGLLFSNQGYCDYPQRVDCAKRQFILGGESNNPKCEKEFEAFRNEAHCNEFFVCVNKLPVRFKCPADLYFNQALGICDYPYRVKCDVSYSLMATEVPSDGGMSSDGNEKVEIKPAVAEKQPSEIKSDFKVFMTNQHDDLTTNIAMSKQEAIDQLQIGRIAKIEISQ